MVLSSLIPIKYSHILVADSNRNVGVSVRLAVRPAVCLFKILLFGDAILSHCIAASSFISFSESLSRYYVNVVVFYWRKRKKRGGEGKR